ncbi:MAG: sigma-54-dependent Fis family transcriptional regulator [Rickettsiaceae bacterium]|jgi:DNA-binding NtrC family response regulator|nr:sigma-54-dependent Fis family transcriptional regulator [Rickettsiaceae bacterium]
MRLLVIGELNSGLDKAAQMALSRGARVIYASNPNEALENLRSGRGADLAIIDVGFDIAGFSQSLVSERITIPILACGFSHDVTAAVQAIKAGAKDYLPLPPDEKLISSIFEAISDTRKPVIYKSKAMQEVIQTADRIARSDASVLITGKSGTGKEVLAHYIHSKSNRASAAFIKLNCAAIPENLLESELFGHEKGAFTGAVTKRIGKFEEANGGTLLLDEISEMDVRLQAKLLRAIQEREFDRVGGSESVKVNIRIIATSNRDLEEEVRKGNFREDLYFRLNIIQLKLPPLQERKEDLFDLCDFFIKKYSDNNGLQVKPLSPSAVAAINSHAWTGNIRELENTMHRAVLLAAGDKIEAEDLRINRTPPGYVGRKIEEVEQELIINTLDYCLGNTNDAANILGITITSLKNKLERYALLHKVNS